jgi:uncharacterized protein (TIGR00255 family)
MTMIRSMTGYGKAEVAIRSRKITLEISAVNNRFLEVSLRLPKSLAEFENEIREAISKLVSRGKLSVSISFDDSAAIRQSLALDESVAKFYHKMFTDLKKRIKLSGDISIDHFIGLPEIFGVASAAAFNKADVKTLLAGIRKAITAMNAMRTSEGKALAKDMISRVRKIERSNELIAKLQPQSLEKYRERLQQLITEILPEGQEGARNYETKLRLDMEVALMADRADTTEECVRLGSHCEAFIAAIEADGDAGKRLNFILQEMNREANTIGSKAILYEISSEVITVKEEIERLREQVQNVE